VTETIREQILAIRDSGVTNMFDVARVRLEAAARGMHELALYIEEHPAPYCRFILTGEMSGE